MVRRWAALDVFYTESGVYPAAALPSGLTWEIPLRWVASPLALHAVFASALLIACAFTLGLGIRLVKWLLLPALFLLNSRVPHLFTGGEVVLHGQALYAIFLPIAEVFSIDAWRSGSRRRATLDPQPTAIASPFYLVLLLQLSAIYLFNQRAKTGLTWQDGSAVAKALGASTLVTNLGATVAQLPPAILRGFTRGTLVVEGVLPLLLLSPWARKWTHALAGALMLALHGGIHLALQIGSFSVAMLCYLPLLWHPRGEEKRVLAPTTRRRRQVEVVGAAALLYVGAARLSHDLIVWPERPQLPLPKLLDRATVALGLWQPWMMFSPDPPELDYVLVTDAVTKRGVHFDPWQQRASGASEPLKTLPESLGRSHAFTIYEIYLSRAADSRLRSFFAGWVLRQQSPDQAPVARFDAWVMIMATDPQRLVNADELDALVGVSPLPLADPAAIKAFAASGVWKPERAFDRKIVPEGTNVLTPVSAAMSAGCPHLTLDLGEPHRLQSAFLQADSADFFWIEGSLDNEAFRPLAQMPRLLSRQHRSRVVALPGEEVRYVRIRPVEPLALRNFLSEVAFFDRVVSLPELASRPSEEFYSALARPAVAGLVSGASHPSPECPAEDPVQGASSRGR
jgi:hypothetical protein